MQSTTPTTEPVPAANATKAPPVMNGDTLPPDEKKECPSSDGYLIEQPPMHPGMPSMNGNMPPQQVYVNNTAMGNHHHHAMMGLENQFHSLGMTEGMSVGHDGSHYDMEGGEHDGEEGGGEEDPVKLFVGQVPKSLNEEDIFPTFDQFGPLKDVAVIRDKHTGLHRGCAFVTFWAAADAEQAQEALHDKYSFPGARRPAQVKPAEPTDPENKLFVGMLSRKAGEMEVRELFEPFGEIREIYMIRNADGTSKCAAFLRYVMRAAAVQAIESLHNNIVMDGSARPLIVKFADNKHQRQQRQVRNMRRQELLATMPNGYPPYQIQPPMAMPGPHNGSLQYPIPPQYAGAYGTPPPTPPHGPYSAGTATPPSTHGAPPHGVYGAGTLPQPHAYGTLPQQPQQQVGGPPHGAYGAGTHPQPHAQYGAGAPPLPPQGGHPQHHGHTHPQHHHPYMYPTHHQQFGPVPPFAYQNQNRQDTRPSNPRPREGPAGANLFVYHLPHDLTDADLATAFNPFGNVISAKVYVDKFTGESKGFGFVSYDSVMSAEAAIEQMNGFQIGNKRLKVQHKRVHGQNDEPIMSQSPVPMPQQPPMQQQQLQMPPMQQQQLQMPPQHQQQQHMPPHPQHNQRNTPPALPVVDP